MTYDLLIGQRLYSSWSLRAWLPFAAFDIPVRVHHALLYDDGFHDTVAAFGGARSVPVLLTPQGAHLTDSLSIAWHLAEAFPDRAMLPNDPADRARAQNHIAEMHAGFTALRAACPMNLATGWAGFVPDTAVLADLARVDHIWSDALDRSGGPFLFGAFGLVDAYFAPVAIRIRGYGLPVSDATQTYVSTILSSDAVRRWRADGLAHDAELSVYDMPLERRAFSMA